MKYMVDTNIINWLVEGSLSTEDFAPDAVFIATHIQHDELSNTRDVTSRKKLIDRFNTFLALQEVEWVNFGHFRGQAAGMSVS